MSPTSTARPATCKAKGVVFEQYDLPGDEWEDGVASMEGMGKAAWFKDSEGNILCIDNGLPGDL